VFLFEGIQWPLIALGWIANIVQRGSTSWHRLRAILDVPSKIKDGPDTKFDLVDIRGDIEFRDVSLRIGRPDAARPRQLPDAVRARPSASPAAPGPARR
jgi:ABC-type multidrug transport system fused ATPase/permease subunit